MILTESLTINGKEFVKTYSDSGYKVERDGVCYDEAIDPAEFGRVYTERLDEDNEIGDAEALEIILGGDS